MFEIDLWIVVAQIINFSILFFIFKKFVSDSMVDLVEERKTLLDKLYKADIYYDEKVKNANTRSEQIINDAHKSAKELLTQSEEIASEKTQKMLKKANTDVKYILDSGRKELEKEKIEMFEEVKEDAIELSLKLNEKLFAWECSNTSFIDKQIKN